jgi:hypothetical protein
VICEIYHLFNRYGSTIAEMVDYIAEFGLEPHRLRDGELMVIDNPRSLLDLSYSADNKLLVYGATLNLIMVSLDYFPKSEHSNNQVLNHDLRRRPCGGSTAITSSVRSDEGVQPFSDGGSLVC